MARGFIRLYRTYSFINKNPVIDKVRTLLQEEGLFKQLGAVADISTVGRGTLDKWFHGDTKNPQHHTIAAVITSLGYEEQFVKQTKIDIEAERKKGKAFSERQRE